MRSLLPLALLALPATLAAQNARLESDPSPRVVASATESARIAPDRVTVYAVVEAEAETAAEAAQRAERKLQTVRDAVRALGAGVQLVSAVPFGVGSAPNFGGYPGTRAPNPFAARYVLRVQSSRVDQVMNLTSALADAGAVTATQHWEATAEDSVRRAKFNDAVAQARADADALASAMGMKLGALIEVVSNAGPANRFEQNFIVGRMMGGMEGPTQPPEVIVNANVTVRYRLVPR